MAKSYGGLQRNRLIVAGLTLGLVTVMFGVLLDIALSGQRTTIAAPTQRLIAPLNPQLDLTVLERIESYELVTFEQAREGVRQARQNSQQSEALVSPGGAPGGGEASGLPAANGGSNPFSQVLQSEQTPAPVTEEFGNSGLNSNSNSNSDSNSDLESSATQPIPGGSTQ